MQNSRREKNSILHFWPHNKIIDRTCKPSESAPTVCFEAPEGNLYWKKQSTFVVSIRQLDGNIYPKKRKEKPCNPCMPLGPSQFYLPAQLLYMKCRWLDHREECCDTMSGPWKQVNKCSLTLWRCMALLLHVVERMAANCPHVWNRAGISDNSEYVSIARRGWGWCELMTMLWDQLLNWYFRLSLSQWPYHIIWHLHIFIKCNITLCGLC